MLVRVNGSFILANFMVMDMEGDLILHLILGRPFLRATRARIDVGRGEIHFRVGKDEGVSHADQDILGYPFGIPDCRVCELHTHVYWGESRV